jgi:hypothetical protein
MLSTTQRKLCILYSLYFEAGFVVRILWRSQSSDHSQNNLAKFGYALDMKVGKKESFYILGYLLELIIKIWKKNSSISGEFESFFSWKFLCLGRNHIFKCWKFASRRNIFFSVFLYWWILDLNKNMILT